MQVDDCRRPSLEELPIPESGRFVNSNSKLKRSLSQRLYRFLERVRFVVPVGREKPQREGKSIKTTSEFSR